MKWELNEHKKDMLQNNLVHECHETVKERLTCFEHQKFYFKILPKKIFNI